VAAGDVSIPDLGARSPELREARDHIDAIDRDIVHLVARRMELVRRAAKAKAAIGAPVLDGAREAEMLAARGQWARDEKVDPAGVEDLFRAILTLSRRSQRT
jgi:prephenate dehydrogenase